MKNLIAIINEPGFAIKGNPITSEDISQTNTELSDCGFPQLPPEIQNFLLHCNGVLHDGRCLWGIDNNKHSLYDILGENLMSNNPYPQDILFLGATDNNFIGWNNRKKCYSIIDKSSFMVLHNFNNFIETVKYILKIND